MLFLTALLTHTTQNHIAALHTKYPLATSLKNATTCLKHLWSVNTRPDLSGKPVLNQIEEGRLQGYTPEEFKVFSERAGLGRMFEFHG